MGNANKLLGIAVRTDRHRYAEFFDPDNGGAMLFDQQTDPHEMTNLANDPKYAGVRSELAALLDRFRKHNAFKNE
jgi:arylsulfatase A-like enzyme